MTITSFFNVETLLIALGLAAFAYLAWQRILWGIYMIAAFLPLYLIRFSVGFFHSTVLELGILILGCIWLIKNSRWKRIRLPIGPASGSLQAVPLRFQLPIALLLIAAGIGFLFSPDTAHALGTLKAYFLEPTLILLIMVYEIKLEQDAVTIMYLLGGLVIVVGLIAVWQSYTGYGIPTAFWANDATRRVTTFFGYPNASALLVGPIVGFYIGYLFKQDSVATHAFKIMVITMGVITILAAHSTGALVAICAVLVMVFLRYKYTRTLMIAGLIIGGTLLLNSARVQDRIVTLQRNVTNNYLDLASSSLEIRINQWRETALLIRDHWLLGAGLDGYQTKLAPYHQYSWLEIYLYPHNIFLNAWTELGLLGLAAFVWLGIVIFKSLLSVIKRSYYATWAWALLYAWVALLVHGLVDVPFFKNDLSVLFMIFVGLTILVWNWSASPVLGKRHSTK